MKRLRRTHDRRGAVPDHGFRMLRVLRERALADIDDFLQPRLVARRARKEVGANQVIEPLRFGRRLLYDRERRRR